jgi:hypothetical protein
MKALKMPLCSPLFESSEFFARNDPPAVLNNPAPNPNSTDVSATTGTTMYVMDATKAKYARADRSITFFSSDLRMIAGAAIAEIPRKK